MERHYYTHLIKDEFANHYFGRETAMFELFRDYHWTDLTPQEYQMTEKQVQYNGTDSGDTYASAAPAAFKPNELQPFGFHLPAYTARRKGPRHLHDERQFN